MRVANHHRLVSELARRFPGVRLTRTEAVIEALVPAILEQKVTGEEARRAWRSLIARVRRTGARAGDLPPAPATAAGALAALPYYAFHPFGVERRRAELIRRVAARAAWFEAIVAMPLPEAYARMTALPGIGPWTAAEVAVRALGDPDAVSVGDFHLPEPRGLRAGGRAAGRRRPDARAPRAVARRAGEGRSGCSS